VLLFMAVVGIGWLTFKGKYQPTRIKPTPTGSLNQRINGSLPVKTTNDARGNRVEAVEIVGEVKKWDPESGIMEYLADKVVSSVLIDPVEAVIFVRSFVDSSKQLIVRDRSSMRWQTAFCQGDQVAFRLDGDRVVLAVNNGYRVCGDKSE